MNKWKFSGSFSDFTAPTKLSSLTRWIVFGLKCATENMSKKYFTKKILDVVTQVVMQSYMSKRQVIYEPKTSVERDSMYFKIKTPLNVGAGLYLHQTLRSKKLLDLFSGFNLSIIYEVIDIKEDVANAVLEKRDENNGVFIPSCLFPSQRPFFAIDNTDMKIDTPTGKRQLNGTAMAAFQQHMHDRTHPIMQIQRKFKQRKANALLYDYTTIRLNYTSANQKAY